MPEFAKRIEAMSSTVGVVRDLFNSMTDPDVISFGGGAPAREALPVDIIREISQDIMTYENRGVEALQYSDPNGAYDLRSAIVENLLLPKGISAGVENVTILNGGMEAMNFICQLYIDPGDVILVESPTFVQSVETFQMFEARCIPCMMDDDGLVMEDVEAKILRYRPKLIYTIPTFQNPTGITLSLERRKKLAELGSKYDVVILEDDPYRDIRYRGKSLPPIKCFDTTGNTILAGSLSKVFSPGSRLGYIVADEAIIRRLYDIHTATNSHTGMISQVLAAEFFNRGYFETHLKKICKIYSERRDVMMECLDTMFPAGTKHTYPEGGLFTWVELPDDLDTAELFPEALERKVAYLPGACFFISDDDRRNNCMRMSFGSLRPEQIRTGMQRLADLINFKLAEKVKNGAA